MALDGCNSRLLPFSVKLDGAVELEHIYLTLGRPMAYDVDILVLVPKF